MQSSPPTDAETTAAPERAADTVFSLALSCLVISCLAGTIYLWSSSTFVLFSAARESISVAIAFLVISFVLVRGRVHTLRMNATGFAWGLFLLVLTDWLVRPYNLLQGEFGRGEIILGSLLTLLLLRSQPARFTRYLLPLGMLLLVSCFFVEARGRLLFSDDNPTFMYRLSLLTENFPAIPFYNPLWNAGIEARDFFATGSLNVFILFSPLLYLFDVFDIYNLIIAAILFLLHPAALWLAARLAGLRSPAPALAGVLGLTASLLWYRWALKYGTLGFVVSSSLMVLNVFVASRICDPEHRPSARELFFAVASFTLMLFWTPSALVFIPLAVIATFKIHKLLKKRAFISFCVLLAVLNIPWMLVFWNVSKVGSFLQSKEPSYASMADERDPQYSYVPKPAEHINTKERTGDFSPAVMLKRIRENSVSTNPLLVFLGLPALLLFRARGRLELIFTAGWLVILGSAVAQVKPQLELDRMLIVLALLLCIPVAELLRRLWQDHRLRWKSLIPSALCGGFLFAGLFSTASILLNRSVEQFYFAGPKVRTLAQTIRAEARGGRAVFSGFVLHDLYHGHLAPLALLSGTPLVASSPFHDQWQYKELFPKEVRDGGDEAIEQYLSLLNTTLVLAHEERWKQYFGAKAQYYTPLLEGGPFNVYRRENYLPSYFLEGEGELVQQSSHRLTLRIDSESATLKFRYFDFLKSSACKLESYDAGSGLVLIRLRECPVGSTITIEARGALSRLLHGAL